MANGPFDYSQQPLQGPGSFNYQPPTNLVAANQAYSGILPGIGGSYLDSLGQYGNPGIVAPTGQFDTAGLFQNITQGLGGLTAIAQLYGMFQSLGLQKKAFKFAQEGTKRNFNAQATAYNDAVASKETARHAYASANNQDYNAMYAYGTGKRIDNWS